jgi:HK97 family phage prohead protease
MTEHKSFPVSDFKAEPDEPGSFNALVSVFGNVDYGGDRVMPGAFTKSLAKWQEAGDPIPVIWNHQWENPLAHIGKVDPSEAIESEDGLAVKGVLDLDNDFARQVHRLLAERRVKELSFGYNVVDSEQKDGANNLIELDLIEVGPTLKGMNPATQLLAVKSYSLAESKAGQALIQALSTEDVAAVTRSSQILASQLEADMKAGARLSKDTRSAITQAIDLLASLVTSDDSSDEDAETKSIEAEATGKASDQDMDLKLRLQLLKEN